MEKIKLGFIGGGINSAIGLTHKIAAEIDSKFEIIAGVFSRNNKVNLNTANEWNIKNVYNNHIDMIEKERNNIDAVVILTPTNTHYDTIMDISHYKIPIICEKTLTTSSKKALEIKELYKNNFLVVTYNYTGYPMVREFKNMIKENVIGEVFYVNIRMPQESFIKVNSDNSTNTPQSWRLKDYEVCTLSLDLGTHLSNMVYFLTEQKPMEVIATQDSKGHFNVIDNILCIINYEKIKCNMWYSKSTLGHKNGLAVEAYGSKGSLFWNQMNPEILEYTDKYGNKNILDRSHSMVTVSNQQRYNRFKVGHPAGFIEAFGNYYDDIYNSLIKYKSGNEWKSEYLFCVDNAIEGLMLMEAIEKSIRNKRWEKV